MNNQWPFAFFTLILLNVIDVHLVDATVYNNIFEDAYLDTVRENL